eukprot:scaffold3784_cov46-Phaeocystis_antarctica.AAC.2
MSTAHSSQALAASIRGEDGPDGARAASSSMQPPVDVGEGVAEEERERDGDEQDGRVPAAPRGVERRRRVGLELSRGGVGAGHDGAAAADVARVRAGRQCARKDGGLGLDRLGLDGLGLGLGRGGGLLGVGRLLRRHLGLGVLVRREGVGLGHLRRLGGRLRRARRLRLGVRRVLGRRARHLRLLLGLDRHVGRVLHARDRARHLLGLPRRRRRLPPPQPRAAAAAAAAAAVPQAHAVPRARHRSLISVGLLRTAVLPGEPHRRALPARAVGHPVLLVRVLLLLRRGLPLGDLALLARRHPPVRARRGVVVALLLAERRRLRLLRLPLLLLRLLRLLRLLLRVVRAALRAVAHVGVRARRGRVVVVVRRLRPLRRRRLRRRLGLARHVRARLRRVVVVAVLRGRHQLGGHALDVALARVVGHDAPRLGVVAQHLLHLRQLAAPPLACHEAAAVLLGLARERERRQRGLLVPLRLADEPLRLLELGHLVRPQPLAPVGSRALLARRRTLQTQSLGRGRAELGVELRRAAGGAVAEHLENGLERGGLRAHRGRHLRRRGRDVREVVPARQQATRATATTAAAAAAAAAVAAGRRLREPAEGLVLGAQGVLDLAVGVLGPAAQLGQLRLARRPGAPADELLARVAPRGVRAVGGVRPRVRVARDGLEIVDGLVGREAGLLGRGRRPLHERLGARRAHAAAAVPGRGEARRLGVVERRLRLGHREHGLAHRHLLRVVLEPRLHLRRRRASRGRRAQVVGVLGRPVLEAVVVGALQSPLLDGEDAHLVHDALQPLLARAQAAVVEARLVERRRLEQPRARLPRAPRDVGAPAATRARARRLDLEQSVAPRVHDGLVRGRVGLSASFRGAGVGVKWRNLYFALEQGGYDKRTLR